MAPENLDWSRCNSMNEHTAEGWCEFRYCEVGYKYKDSEKPLVLGCDKEKGTYTWTQQQSDFETCGERDCGLEEWR